MIRHMKDTDLALYATGDLRPWQRAVVHLHVRQCERCSQTVEEFRADGRALRDAAAGLPDGVDWARLSAEMTANIRVGLAAGECVSPRRVQRVRQWIPNSWRPVALASMVTAGLAALLVGANLPFFGNVTGNIMALVKSLGDAGLVGLITLGIIIWLFAQRRMA